MHDSIDDNAAQMEMPKYVSHKTVWALEIDTTGTPDHPGRLTFRDKGYGAVDTPPEMWMRYTPIPGDYYVQYADGYKSFSPRKAFLEGYTRV